MMTPSESLATLRLTSSAFAFQFQPALTDKSRHRVLHLMGQGVFLFDAGREGRSFGISGHLQIRGTMKGS